LPEAKAATLSTYQNLAMALVIELLIVMSLVAGEVLEHHETQPAAEALKAVPAREPQKPVEPPFVVEAHSTPTRAPNAFPAPARPRLIASRADPVGSVAVIMADVFAAYAEACEASGKRPIPANEFPAAISELCQRLGIEIEDNEKGVFLLKVRTKKVATRVQSQR
jgi:hypothetical protein